MIIIWGSRLYGKVDEVPGMFHVATKFGHLWYIPLIPMGSHLVVQRTGQGWRGVPIGLSGKSVLVAWLRAGGIAGMIIAGIGMAAEANDPHGPLGLIAAAVLFAVCLVVTIFAFAAKFLRHASYERAKTLADTIKLTDEGRILLELRFKRLTQEQAKAALEEVAKDRNEMAQLAAGQEAPRVPV